MPAALPPIPPAITAHHYEISDDRQSCPAGQVIVGATCEERNLGSLAHSADPGDYAAAMLAGLALIFIL